MYERCHLSHLVRMRCEAVRNVHLILGQAGHCAGHYSGDTTNHTILYYPITYTNPSSFAEHYVMNLGTS